MSYYFNLIIFGQRIKFDKTGTIAGQCLFGKVMAMSVWGLTVFAHVLGTLTNAFAGDASVDATVGFVSELGT